MLGQMHGTKRGLQKRLSSGELLDGAQAENLNPRPITGRSQKIREDLGIIEVLLGLIRV